MLKIANLLKLMKPANAGLGIVIDQSGNAVAASVAGAQGPVGPVGPAGKDGAAASLVDGGIGAYKIVTVLGVFVGYNSNVTSAIIPALGPGTWSSRDTFNGAVDNAGTITLMPYQLFVRVA